MLTITGFEKGSVLKRLGFLKGDAIEAFDGYSVVDELDYIFYDSKDEFEIRAVRNGEYFVRRVIKKDGEVMGVLFDGGAIEPIECRNKCLFCFVDQMRPDMRKTLYIKDDDYRLSFMGGNYITLTNLSGGDIDRIKRLKLSPLYVSVHAYDGAVRRRLLGNRFAGLFFDILRDLGSSGICFHAQIVLLEGINDGAVLEETVEELYKLSYVLSVAIVPVGLTRYRDSLPDILPVSRECAEKVVGFSEEFAKKALADRGSAFVWCADELYLRAFHELPAAKFYGDFCQLENGVGMISKFIEEAKSFVPKARRSAGKRGPEQKVIKAELITGESFYPFLHALAAYFSERMPEVKLKAVKIRNDFFGDGVTVAGLLTGRDIAEQLKPDADTDAVLIPAAALREGCDTFLDGVTLSELSELIGKRIYASPDDGGEFARLLYELRRA